MAARDPAAPTIHVVRNEFDPDSEFHCDALAARTADALAAVTTDGPAEPSVVEVDAVAGERVPLDETDGVVLTGSTAGVYEDEHADWIADERDLVRELVDREVPTLGVCFGHQVVNEALGGAVEARETTAGLVAAELDDDPLFDGVAPIVPALHGDVVTEPGDDLDVIATAPHAAVFATRHRSAPLWTVQFHPEFTADLEAYLREERDFATDPHDFADVTAVRVLENFAEIVAEAAADGERPESDAADGDRQRSRTADAE